MKRSGDGRLEAWAVEHVTAFRIGMLALAAIVGLVEIGTRFGLKWIPTWADSGGLTLMVVGTFSEGIWGIRRAKRRRTEEGRQLDLEKQMVSVLVSIAKLTGIDVDIPGCNVWSIQGTRETPLLHREYRRRLSDFPQPSPVEWTQGKGVIGRCWQEGETLHQDWRPAQDKWAGKEQVSEAEWKGMSARERWGFDRTEYLRSIRKYAEILAVPIKDDDGHTLGVLSVDIPTDRSNGGVGCLAGGDVREVLTHAAISLRSFV